MSDQLFQLVVNLTTGVKILWGLHFKKVILVTKAAIYLPVGPGL